MPMSISITASDGTTCEASVGGKYAPDVMHDLTNRVADLLARTIRVMDEPVPFASDPAETEDAA